VIARGLLVLGQRLEEHKDGPGIIWIAIVHILERAQPAIFLLVAEDRDDPMPYLLFQPFVLQEESQGNQAIQPVGTALPSFALSSNPRAVSNIRPELIKVTGQSIGLDAQLRVQPSLWTNAPQRQRRKSIFNQPTSGFRLFCHTHTSC
jgi:hypothetical protein